MPALGESGPLSAGVFRSRWVQTGCGSYEKAYSPGCRESGAAMDVMKTNAIGLRVMTELVVSRLGFNPDTTLATMTCRRCGKLLLGSRIVSTQAPSTITIRTADRHSYVLEVSETMHVDCACGRTYTIVLYGPALYGDDCCSASAIVEYTGCSKQHTGSLSNKLPAVTMPGEQSLLSREMMDTVSHIVRLAGRGGLPIIEENWHESRYGYGWIAL
jgi:hypothetical protein